MKTDYEQFERTDGGKRLLRQETLIMEVLEEVARVLSFEHISRVRLAQRLGKTKGLVSQILADGSNLTLRTIADVCWAIGYRPQIKLRKDHRSLVSLPSVQKRVRAVDWAAGQHELDVNMKKLPSHPAEALMTADQKVGLVA